MLLIAIFGCYGFARAVVIAEATGEFAQIRADRNAPGQFPTHIGAYTLVRTWNENLNTGTLLFHWAEYAPANGGAHITLGISPVLGSHDTLICHSARGDDPIWQNQITTATAGQPNVSFSGAMFNDSSSLSLEATTVCSGSSCGEYTTRSLSLRLRLQQAELPIDPHSGSPAPHPHHAPHRDRRRLGTCRLCSPANVCCS